jgi:hypothetical protein
MSRVSLILMPDLSALFSSQINVKRPRRFED